MDSANPQFKESIENIPGPNTEPGDDSAFHESDLAPGTEVMYSLHGRCRVIGIEARNVGGKTIPFLRLEPAKGGPVRQNRKEPIISLPLDAAKNGHLRNPATEKEAHEILPLLSSDDSFVSLDLPWSEAQIELEKLIRTEGAQGLIKAYGYLSLLKRRKILLNPEIQKFFDSVSKVVIREMSLALNITAKETEAKITKFLAPKIAADGF